MRRILILVTCWFAVSSLVHAQVQRTELMTKGDWTINACSKNGKPRGAEMWRTYDGKHEVHLRLRSNQDGVFLDASGDWSGLSEAKTQPVEIRVNSAKGKPVWKGQGKVIEDADGLPWLSMDLGKSSEGDMTEGVLVAMLDGGKTLNLSIGKPSVQWAFDLAGASAAYDAMWDYLQKSDAAAVTD